MASTVLVLGLALRAPVCSARGGGLLGVDRDVDILSQNGTDVQRKVGEILVQSKPPWVSWLPSNCTEEEEEEGEVEWHEHGRVGGGEVAIQPADEQGLGGRGVVQQLYGVDTC